MAARVAAASVLSCVVAEGGRRRVPRERPMTSKETFSWQSVFVRS